MGTLGPKYILHGYMEPLGSRCSREAHYGSSGLAQRIGRALFHGFVGS